MSSPALEAEEGDDPRSVKLTEHDSQQENSAPMSLHSASSLSMSSLAITPRDTNAGAANGASDDFLKSSSKSSSSSHGFSDSHTHQSSSNALQNNDSMMKMLVASRRASLPHLPNRRKGNDLSDLTIDKLDFTSLKKRMYGRSQEIAQLQSIWDNQCNASSDGQQQRRELIVIKGKSGEGKTRLAEIFLKFTVERRKGLYVRGKFHLTNGDNAAATAPYTGIAGACAEVCGAIIELRKHDATKSARICQQIQTELGSELSLLVQVIPTLVEIVETDILPETTAATGASSPPSASTSASMESKNQIQFVMLRFIRIISSHFEPFIMVLDDLQWADASSLDLLQVLLTDSQTSKLVIVAIYRSEELVDETHVLQKCFVELEAKAQQEDSGDFFITTIEIGSFNVATIQELIEDLLSMEDDSSRRVFHLAQLCHKKTLGNAFFLLHFLSTLHELELLQFNFGSMTWVWDEGQIEASTTAAENVIGLLKTKMNHLPHDYTQLLQYAAFLGSTFSVLCIKILWDKLIQSPPLSSSSPIEDNQRCTQEFLDAINALETAGFISKVADFSTTLGSGPSYNWAHDKLQEAALDVIPNVERSAHFQRIGEILLLELKGRPELEAVLFVVVNLLNNGQPQHSADDFCSELARLNCAASQKAMGLSAFESAAAYAGAGIRLLPSDVWSKERHLALQLYSMGAKTEGFVGNVDTMEEYCNMVIGREELSMMEKLDVYNTRLDSMANRGKVPEAIELLLKILKHFDCHFPTNSMMIGLQIVRNIIRVKATMKKWKPSNLRPMTNPTVVELMKLVQKLNFYFYMVSDSRMALTVFRSLNWTIKYGYCGASPVAFVHTAVIVTGILNDIQGGAVYGQHALDLLKMTKSRTQAARTMFPAYTLILSWTKPLNEILPALVEAYDIGLQAGDTESASWSIFLWIIMKYMIGSTAVETMEADLVIYTKQMKDLKRIPVLRQASLFRQVTLNLLGRNNVDNPTVLVGDAVSQELYDSAKDNAFVRAGIFAYEGILLTYFGEHLRQADLMVQCGADYYGKILVASPNQMFDSYLKGVSCFAAARKTDQAKYARVGEQFLTKLKGWRKQGCPNVRRYEILLTAEMMAYSGKTKDAIKHYEEAILRSARGGHQHDAALANERLGEFYLVALGDQEEGAYRINEAKKYWGRWGAIAKVRHLERKYPSMATQPSEVCGIQGRAGELRLSTEDSLASS